MTFSTVSLSFDGIDGYVDLGDETAFQKDNIDAFSISCWAKTKAISVVNTLVGKMTSVTGQRGYLMYLTPSGQFEAVIRNTETTDSLRKRTVVSRLNEGGWHHFVMTFDGSGSLLLYVDGILKNTTTIYNNLTSTILVAKSLQIGAYDGYTAPFEGNIDEVAFFNAELSANEVLAIFNSAQPVSLFGTSSLVGWWQLGENAGFPIVRDEVLGVTTYPTIPNDVGPSFPDLLDQSGNSYDGTVINMEVADIQNDNPGGSFSRRSMVFDGSNERVNMGDVLDFDRFDARSYSFWYKTTTTSTSYIITKHGTGDPEGWVIVANSNGKLLIELVKVHVTNDIGIESSATHNDGFWHHVVITWSGSTGTASDCKMYFDSVEDVSLSVYRNGLTGSIANSYDLILGDDFQPALPYAGSMDEVAVYDKELSSAEVTTIYNSGAPNDLSLLGSAANLQAWWRMGEGIYDGTMINMTSGDIVSDVPGGTFTKYSIQFDGSADYVTMGDVLGYEYNEAFSVSCWIMSIDVDGMMVSKRDGATAYQGWSVQLHTAGYIEWGLWNDEGSSLFAAIITTNAFNDGEWYHVLCTSSGSGTVAGLKIYVNGVEQATTTESDTLGSNSILTTASFNVAARTDGSVLYEGNLDDISLWNKELSQSEITELYNSGVPGNLFVHSGVANLDAWWWMGDAPGNDGVMTNMDSLDIVINAPKEPGVIGEQIDYFLMRGIDTACGSLTYHHWTVTEFPDFAGTSAGTLPCGGPLTDIVIAAHWSVIN